MELDKTLKVLQLIKTEPSFTTDQIADFTGFSKSTVNRQIAALREVVPYGFGMTISYDRMDRAWVIEEFGLFQNATTLKKVIAMLEPR